MAFELWKQGKLADRLESDVYEWAEWYIEDFYGCVIEDLTQDQIDEIYAVADDDEECWVPYLGTCLRSICERWEEEQDEEE